MSGSGTHAEQPALDGLAPRKRRRRAPAEKTPAEHLPIARVMIDVQATHLGRTFDYLVDERSSKDAQPGVRVRVRFGHKLLDGFVWQRADRSDTPSSSLRFLERVISPRVVLSEQMRRDVTRIADTFGGTVANILRVAVPPRSAKVDREYTAGDRAVRRRADELAAMLADPDLKGFARIESSYSGARDLRDALNARTGSTVIWDDLPGPRLWAKDLAWAVAHTLMIGRSAVVVLPDMRHVADMARSLAAYGLKPYKPSDNGVWSGDVAALEASMAPELRYRSYMAVATGAVRCVIGVRAAMYAPVEGPALFAIVDDAAYQNADGLMPYANARDVLELRAREHGGVFIAAGHARSPLSQWQADHGRHVVQLHALPSVAKDATPWIRWLNREELARLADPAIGARVPHTAVSVINRALKTGPVLLSVPYRGAGTVLACARCHRQARCPKCAGPLTAMPDAAAQCRWCGAAAVDWTCRECGGDRMRAVRIGAEGTMQELRGLFRGVPIMVSTPNQPRGIIEDVVGKPQIVIATPGAEPRVVPMRPGPSGESAGAAGTATSSAYQAVVILDAWTSLYAPGIDARVDALTAWMRAAALCAPRTRGGQVLLVGEADPALAHSLVVWDPRILASRELAEREETVLPPVVAAAAVWGDLKAVMTALDRIGALTGDMAVMTVSDGNPGIMPGADPGTVDMDDTGDPDADTDTDLDTDLDMEWPAVLGPVPIAPEPGPGRTLDGSQDRVRAIVRVRRERSEELAKRLRIAVSTHVAGREPGELRFKINPKDVL
ncbi:primosomal protein N' [Bifidobacterium simiarum]|uniref:Primosome assembly protein PriA n=1 Tax=Bifidobacterium simiarum TaxID=2045441 RepID=A0A2M9HGT0_9BIFI|nr:primosomal protein N' [Bifidobacterium simiarum]PJM76007.1 primosome assembly protein PriA [Bifidobacterium simiarum]